MGKLEDLPNIGKVVAQQLIQVGIDDPIKLKEVGCIHRLYAPEGAVEGIKKTQLDYETKAELKQFYNEHKL